MDQNLPIDIYAVDVMPEKHVVYPDNYSLSKMGNFYMRHVNCMTKYQLERKSEIAEQLAWRDMRIAELEAQLAVSHAADFRRLEELCEKPVDMLQTIRVVDALYKQKASMHKDGVLGTVTFREIETTLEGFKHFQAGDVRALRAWMQGPGLPTRKLPPAALNKDLAEDPFNVMTAAMVDALIFESMKIKDEAVMAQVEGISESFLERCKVMEIRWKEVHTNFADSRQLRERLQTEFEAIPANERGTVVARINEQLHQEVIRLQNTLNTIANNAPLIHTDAPDPLRMLQEFIDNDATDIAPASAERLDDIVKAMRLTKVLSNAAVVIPKRLPPNSPEFDLDDQLTLLIYASMTTPAGRRWPSKDQTFNLAYHIAQCMRDMFEYIDSANKLGDWQNVFEKSFHEALKETNSPTARKHGVYNSTYTRFAESVCGKMMTTLMRNVQKAALVDPDKPNMQLRARMYDWVRQWAWMVGDEIFNLQDENNPKEHFNALCVSHEGFVNVEPASVELDRFIMRELEVPNAPLSQFHQNLNKESNHDGQQEEPQR